MTQKRSKRILSITIKHICDTDPDTSYLGEYANSPKGDYSIDRAHSLDCAINGGEPESSDLDTHKAWDKPQYHAPKDDDRRIEYCDSCERLVRTVPGEGVVNQSLRCCEWCGSYTEEQDITACTCDESGDMARNEYRYFNTSGNYKGEPIEDIRKYTIQDYKRMESLNRGDWQYIGIRASAEVQLSGDVVQTIESGGLWGIESDSDISHFAEVESEELAQLKTELHEMGFSKRAIATACKDIRHKDE